jgi:hypothetical protein
MRNASLARFLKKYIENFISQEKKKNLWLHWERETD